MAHRGLGYLERRGSVARHRAAGRLDLAGFLVVFGTIAAVAVVYLLYFLIVYSTVTP
jgi:hypothetical protein